MVASSTPFGIFVLGAPAGHGHCSPKQVTPESLQPLHFSFSTFLSSLLGLFDLPPDEVFDGLLLPVLGDSFPLFDPGLALLDFTAFESLDLAELLLAPPSSLRLFS